MKIANDARLKHGAPCASWSARAEKFAAVHSASLATKQTNGMMLEHGDLDPDAQGMPTLGQNLYAEEGEQLPVSDIAVQGVQSWLAEESSYNYNSPGWNGGVAGHFTQVVWKDSTGVGCSTAYATGLPEGSMPIAILTCDYEPPGNVEGEWTQQVQKPTT